MYHGNLVASLAMIFSTKRSLLGWNIRHTLNQLSYEALLTQYVIRLNKFYSKEPEILLYNSYRSKKIHEAFGLCANNGTVIPNGIDIEKFQYSSKARKHLRNILGISLNSFVVGHAARFHPMKNHSLAIKVMVRFAMSNPKVQFIFVGRDITWENEKITTLILPSVRAQFHLLGERKDMPAIYNTLDLFLSTSSYGEGFPNVIGEAMSTGVPCVATDVGDCKLIIGKTGIIVPTNDAIAITSGIVKIFARLLNNRISFREITRKRIETNFSLKSIVDRYADLYAKKMHYYKT